MVVCYDAHASPIWDMQRCGRTGRHRGGRVVQLLALGKEEGDYEKQQLASLWPISRITVPFWSELSLLVLAQVLP